MVPQSFSSTDPMEPPGADVLSRLINLSGRQRMLSQRLTLFIVLAGQGQDGALEAAEEVLQHLTSSQRKLIEGGDGWPGLFNDVLRQVFDGPTQARKRIQAFIGLAEQILSSLRQGVPLQPAVQAGLVESATAVLSLFNLVTQSFEQQARELAQRQQHERDRTAATLRNLAHEMRRVQQQVLTAHASQPSDTAMALSLPAQLVSLADDLDALARSASSPL